jgi:hypothetical protein
MWYSRGMKKAPAMYQASEGVTPQRFVEGNASMCPDSTTKPSSRITDLLGQPFERLTVIAFAGTRNGQAVWTCQCVCGTVVDVPAKQLRTRNTRSCGCLKRDILQDPRTNPRPNTVNLQGQTIGSWFVMEHAGVREGHTFWTCRCVCGTVRDLPAYRLKRRHSNSCGCEKGRKIQQANTKHGRCYTSEYHSWSAMNQRCHNPRAMNYDVYGGRGITVCDAWRHSFETFFADMGPRPTPGHSIERLDNDLGYSKANCIWGTRKEQSFNRRTTIHITYNSETLTAKEWEAKVGTPSRNILERLRQGWTVEDALFIPVSPNNNGLHRRDRSAYYGTSYSQ